MAQPLQVSQPRLATGCRWGVHRGEPVVLYPEGMIRVEGSGRKILELCDGQSSVQQIVASLAEHYENVDTERVARDVTMFLEALHHKRIVDY